MGLIFPEPIIYFRHCEKHWNEIIHRNELHFASGMVIFLVMSAYQLVVSPFFVPSFIFPKFLVFLPVDGVEQISGSEAHFFPCDQH
jgi:hypothetical protein